MELHANAALSLNKRRLLAQRVVEQGWTLTKAAAAAEVSVRCARKWVGRYRSEGELGLLDRSSAPALVANRTPESRVEAIAALRRLRFTGPEIAELLSMALSTVSGILTRIGMGKLGRLGLESARRYERAHPGELVHVDVSSAGSSEGRATGCSGAATQPRPHRRRRAAPPPGWLGVRPHRDRRLHPPGLRRGATRREGDHSDRFPAPRGRFLPAPRHHSRAAADRQRLRLPLNRARDRLPRLFRWVRNGSAELL
jgi:transposase